MRNILEMVVVGVVQSCNISSLKEKEKETKRKRKKKKKK